MQHAARTLSRRIEPRALVVSSLLFLRANCEDLAVSTAVIAFKEASNKNEFSKFEPILKHIPQLQVRLNSCVILKIAYLRLGAVWPLLL